MSKLGCSDGSIGIGALFGGADVFGRAPDVTIANIASWVCRGGWPAMRGMSDRMCTRLNGQYLGAVFDEDAPRKGLSPSMARNALAALARNVATAATYKTLRADMARGEEGSVSDDEVVKYLDLFKGMYLIEEVPGWDVGIRSKKHLRTKPKRYFADPALAARMLGVSASALLTDTQLLGLLFENLCLRDLAAKNAAQRMPAPSFLAVLVGRASYAHSTPEGVRVVPVNMLGIS